MESHEVNLQDVRAVARYLNSNTRAPRVVFTPGWDVTAAQMVQSIVFAGGQLEDWQHRRIGGAVCGMRIIQAIVMLDPVEIRRSHYAQEQVMRWIHEVLELRFHDKPPGYLTIVD